MSFNYAPVGATRELAVPAGFSGLRGRRRVGDSARFEQAAAYVLGLGMQRGSGLEIAEGEVALAPGVEVTMVLRAGPLRLRIPTRVVYVVDEPDRRGFAYGTLPGHPERGEELFVVERTGEATYAEVRAFSRPGSWYTRLGAPLARRVQARFARRYLDALERALARPL